MKNLKTTNISGYTVHVRAEFTSLCPTKGGILYWVKICLYIFGHKLILIISYKSPNKAPIRELVDSLCRDGMDAQYIQYLSKSCITSTQICYKPI